MTDLETILNYNAKISEFEKIILQKIKAGEDIAIEIADYFNFLETHAAFILHGKLGKISTEMIVASILHARKWIMSNTQLKNAYEACKTDSKTFEYLERIKIAT